LLVKLALVSAKFPFGGKEPYLDAELRALAPHLDGITVFPTSPTSRRWGFSNVAADVVRLGLWSPATLWGAFVAIVTRPARSLRAVSALLRAPYRGSVKVKNLAVVPLGLALGVRLARERFDHVHSYWLSTPATVAYLAAQVAGIPWSSSGHLWDIYEDNALAVKLPDAAFVRAISLRGQRDLLATLDGRRSLARVRVVHVGVEVPSHAPVRSRAPSRPFAILCAANLVLKKGHADLLEALATLRSRGVAVACTIAGDGELRAALEARAGALGLGESVCFRGHVPHGALLAEIGAGDYDAMVLTSLELPGGLMEGVPVALMEAMALGLPVITTDTGSIGELVDESCGRIVPQRDVARIAAAIAELATSAALRAQLAQAAYEKVRRDFNVLGVAERLAELMRTA
jgi:colanic acid/amylovoran biosynthesis glycosyltransferase